MNNSNPHLLYNYRRCPYAMRTRMALVRAGVSFECHDIDFKNKPSRMLELSPKGTVPVLVLNDGTVLDESIDIIKWALPDEWADANHDLIAENDGAFKSALDRYKYPNRFPDEDCSNARTSGAAFIQTLNDVVNTDDLTLTDICIFPFVRQFCAVDKEWFDVLLFDNTQNWLQHCIESEMFKLILDKKFSGTI